MSGTTRGLISILFIFLVGLFDQWSKWFVIERHFRLFSLKSEGPSVGFIDWLTTIPQDQFPFERTVVTPFFNIVMVWNKGVSFGMFASDHNVMPYILMVMALALTGFFVFWMWRSKSLLASLPLALVVAGAVSNVWDRMRFKAVADFLDFHIGDIHWPAFNVADSCIVVGVAGLALHTLLSGKASGAETK